MAAQVLVEVYRFGESPDRTAFRAVCTLTYTLAGTVEISGLCGEFTAADKTELTRYLTAKGVRQARAVIKGKEVFFNG